MQDDQQPSAWRSAAALALSASILMGAASPAFAEPAPESRQRVEHFAPVLKPAFLPNISDQVKSQDGTNTADDETLTSDEKATVALFERNTPSVVNITNLGAYRQKCARWRSCMACILHCMRTVLDA